jgi:hypothetical protein
MVRRPILDYGCAQARYGRSRWHRKVNPLFPQTGPLVLLVDLEARRRLRALEPWSVRAEVKQKLCSGVLFIVSAAFLSWASAEARCNLRRVTTEDIKHVYFQQVEACALALVSSWSGREW